MRVWVSRAISLGVVPLEIRAWKPLMAPQAMVMKAKGKIFPAKTGPGAVHKARERGHVQSGMQRDDTDAEKGNRPQLHKRAQVIAGSQQQPNRKSRGCESVHDDENRQSGRA